MLPLTDWPAAERQRIVGVFTDIDDTLTTEGVVPPATVQALADLHGAGCDLVTITQYLRPSPRHHPVERWVRPEEFVALADVATGLGFAGVMSGPLVRSSYRAGRLYQQALDARGSGAGARITAAFGS